MLQLIRNTLVLARAEIRVARRLLRFKALVAVVSVCLLGSYAVSCSIYFNVAPYAPSFVASTPLYLLENIDPIFYLAFMVSAFLMAFDIDHRHARNRIEEVLQAKPVSNLEWMAGRVLGCAGLLWTVVAINVVAMQLVGLLAQIAGADFARSLQSHSVFVLLVVDAPAFLIAWCSLVVFLQSAFRNRILVAAVILVAAFASYVLLLYVPYWFVDLVSPSSNDTLFISDIAPQLPSASSILMRVGSLAGVAALIASAAWLYRRQDVMSTGKTVGCAVACVAVGAAAFSAAVVHRLQQVDEVATWREAHQEVAWVKSIDLRSMSGQVRIDPKTRMYLDLSLDFTTIPVSTAPKLTFSFNPGMSIEAIELDGAVQSFSFRHGILEIPFASTVASELNHTIRIVASGVPNPRFAYFDAPLDYALKPGIPLQVTKSFGLDGSIYGREYVALMPGAHWYPTQGPVNRRFGDGRNGLDYFELDLQIELSNPNWKLVGPGVSKVEGAEGNLYFAQPSAPIPEVGLFASEFEGVSTNVQGVGVAMYLHSRHGNKLRVQDQVRKDMLAWLNEFLHGQQWNGPAFVHDSVTLIEVPGRLRTVAGGWRMDALNALPGLVLLKDRGFPVAPTHLAIRREKHPDLRFPSLQGFFQRGLGTDNLTNTLPYHGWIHATSATGPNAEVLDQIVLSLVARMNTWWVRGSFSAYSTMQFVSITSPSFWQAVDSWGSQSLDFRENIHWLESNYARRNTVQARMENTSLVEVPSAEGHQHDLEFVLLKSARIADVILSYHNDHNERILSWLAHVRDEFKGRNYRHEDLIAIALDHGVVVDPFLTDWLTSSTLPGFVVSRGSVAELEYSDDGKRRLQVSFSVRNTEPVGGFVIPLFGEETGPIHINANSAKQLNLVWGNAPNTLESGSEFSFPLVAGLSLNRGSVSVTMDIDDIPKARPRATLENSDWAPEQKGIVVDDLDVGFSVLQPIRSSTKRLRASSVDTWFRPQTPEFEHDGQLAEVGRDYSPVSGRWTRTVDPYAFGLHRRTIAIAKVSGSKFVYTARFAAEIPEANLWRLQFHVHYPHWSDSYEFAPINLQIDDGMRTWSVDFDPSTENPRWKTVGEFDLSTGTVHVNVGGTKRRSLIYADAIRWLPVEQAPAVE